MAYASKYYDPVKAREYYEKHNLSVMEKLFAGYMNERLDKYLAML